MILFTYRCRHCGKRAPLEPVEPAESQSCIHCHAPCDPTPEAVRIERERQPRIEEWEGDLDEAAGNFWAPPAAARPPAAKVESAQKAVSAPAAPAPPKPKKAGRRPPVCPNCRRTQQLNPATGEFPDVCKCGHSFVAPAVPNLAAGAVKPAEKRQIGRLVADNWLLGIGLGVFVAIGAAVFFMKREPAPATEPPASVKAKDAVWDDVAPVVRSFLAARTAAELFPLVRDAQEMAPAVQEWIEAGNELPLGGYIEARSAPQVFGPHKVWEVQVRSGKGVPLSFVLAHTPAGNFVDWPSLTGKAPGDLSLAELLRTRPETPRRVRVFLRPVSYYNNSFSDPAAHWSLAMTDPDDKETAYAYAPKNSPIIAAWIKRFFSRPVQQPATVLVQFPPGSAEGANQVEIVVVEGTGWYVP